jgi:hypothetical protein
MVAIGFKGGPMSETRAEQVRLIKANARDYRILANHMENIGLSELAKEYMDETEALEAGAAALEDHDKLVAALLDLAGNAGAAVAAYRRGGSAVPAIDALRYATNRAADVCKRITLKKSDTREKNK